MIRIVRAKPVECERTTDENVFIRDEYRARRPHGHSIISLLLLLCQWTDRQCPPVSHLDLHLAMEQIIRYILSLKAKTRESVIEQKEEIR